MLRQFSERQWDFGYSVCSLVGRAYVFIQMMSHVRCVFMLRLRRSDKMQISAVSVQRRGRPAHKQAITAASSSRYSLADFWETTSLINWSPDGVVVSLRWAVLWRCCAARHGLPPLRPSLSAVPRVAALVSRRFLSFATFVPFESSYFNRRIAGTLTKKTSKLCLNSKKARDRVFIRL